MSQLSASRADGSLARGASPALFVLLLCTGGLVAVTAQESEAPANKAAATPWVHEIAEDSVLEFRATVRAALARELDWKYEQLPLEDAAADLEQRTGLPFTLDAKGLDDVGAAKDTPVTLIAGKLSVRSALQQMLAEHGLEMMLRAGCVVITSPDAAAAPDGGQMIKLYSIPRPTEKPNEWGDRNSRPFATSVVPVVSWGGQGQTPSYFTPNEKGGGYDALVDLLEAMIDPPSWSAMGGPATIRVVEERGLLIGQSWENHERVEALLALLLQLKRDFVANPQTAGVSRRDVGGGEALRKSLAARESLRFSGTAAEFATKLQKQIGRTVFLDRRGLDELGLTPDTNLEGRAAGSLRAGITSFLRPYNLNFFLRRDALVITSEDQSGLPANQTLALFPIHDLLPAGQADDADEAAAALVESITHSLASSSWQEVGGLASISAWNDPPTLVVTQQEDVLAQIDDLLTQLRKAKTAEPAVAAKPGMRRRLFVIRTETVVEAKGTKADKGQKEQEATTDQTVVSTVTAATPEMMKELIEFLKRNVAPDRWKEEGVVLDHWRNQLLVRHQPEVMREVEKLLARMGPADYRGTGLLLRHSAGLTSPSGQSTPGFFTVPTEH